MSASCEAFLYVSQGMTEPLGHVAGITVCDAHLLGFQALVKKECVLFCAFGRCKHCGQELVVDLYEGNGLFRYIWAVGCNGSDGVSLVQDLVAGENVVAKELEAGYAFAQVDLGIRRTGVGVEVPVSDDGLHARQRFCGGGVNGEDNCVGVGTSEHLAVQKDGWVVVGAIFGGACYLIRAVMPDGACAHHVECLGSENHVGLIIRHCITFLGLYCGNVQANIREGTGACRVVG